MCDQTETETEADVITSHVLHLFSASAVWLQYLTILIFSFYLVYMNLLIFLVV